MRARATRGHDLVRRAEAVIPGGTTNAAVLPAGMEFIVEGGDGPYLHTSDGRRLLDLVLGGGPLVLGHRHPRLLEAVARSAEQGTHHYAVHRRTVELAERLVELVPSAEMVRFTASGSEATFHALRLARAVTGRPGIVKFDGGYHGHHDLAVWSFEHSDGGDLRPVAESAGIQHGVVDDVLTLPFNDAEAITDALHREPERFAAVICEPFQRAVPPAPGFLEAVREACDRTGTVLIFDEVAIGFRVPTGTAQALYGVTPDVTTVGKALAGGLPLAALVGSRDLMQHLDPRSAEASRSFHCGTFNGYLLAVDAAHATLDVMVVEGGLATLQEVSGLAVDAMSRAFADAGVALHITCVGGIFQTYFTSEPVRSAADVRKTGTAELAEYVKLLLEAGVYRLGPKGYLSVVDGPDQIDELEAATRWALGRIGAVT